MAQAHHQPVRVAGYIRAAQMVGEQEKHKVGRAVFDAHGNACRIGVRVEPAGRQAVALEETLRALRVGLVALSEQLTMGDVKVPV